MTEPAPPPTWRIVASLALALFLAILPLPFWAEPYRPQWLALTLIFWCLTQPMRVGVFWGFGTGLVADVLRGSLLGQHALTLSLVAYLAVELHRRVLPFPPWQQAFSVWLMLVMERLLTLWIMVATGHPTPTLAYWLPTLTGALLWPWWAAVLRGLSPRGATD